MKGVLKKISAVLLSSAFLVSCGSGAGDSGSVSPAAVQVSETVTEAYVEKEPELPIIEGFKGKSDSSSFKLEWESVQGAYGYELEMTITGAGESEKHFISGELNEYTLTDRESGERAEFVLRAYVRNGADNRYIACSEPVTLTTMREKYELNVQSVCQYSKPALPTGCECTALTTVLRYYGFDVTKNEIAGTYLEKVAFTEKKASKKDINAGAVLIGADPEEAFPGDPADENGYGCYSKPISDAANKYLTTQKTKLRATAVDGKKLSYWYSYVNNGTPIVIWATDGLKASKKIDAWQTKEGKEIQWLTNEHCYVLIGFDTQKGTVTCCNPISRQVVPVEFDAKLFEKRYKEQGRRAVVIE